MDPFEPVNPPVGGSLYTTIKSGLDAEFDTTQSCAETGCGGGPLDFDIA
ncbi:MAG TPA: hypothetical protein VNZ52_08135 [Candidatus Thermoplasmatota archaeon]|nr:hypothetical protein [Candidatus Thermoplasmatota archaeon]